MAIETAKTMGNQKRSKEIHTMKGRAMTQVISGLKELEVTATVTLPPSMRAVKNTIVRWDARE